MRAITLTRRRRVRAVLLYSVFVGVAGLGYLLFVSNVDFGAAFRAYHYAASASLAGEPFYGVSAPGYDSTFIYPPVTILFFYPFALIENWRISFALMTALNVCLAIGLARCLIWFIESRGERLERADKGLVMIFGLLAILTVQVYLQGQVNLFLALAITYAFVRLDQGDERSAGALLAIAALFKYFPALFGLYLLKRRAFRAVGAAILTGTGLLAFGYLVFGQAVHEYYIGNVLSSRYIFSSELPPTVNLVTLWRPLSYALPQGGPTVYLLVSAAIMAPILGFVYIRANTEMGDLFAILATVITIIVVLPSKLPYLVILHFPLVPLLYLVEDCLVHRILIAGTVVVSLAFNLGHVREIVEILVPSAQLQDVLLSVLEPLLTVATPPLYGLLILLLGCVVYVYREATDTAEPVHQRA